jgi:SAM-dependent methyltransferase
MQGDVLDFGCGSKPYRELFTACSSYTGVDIAVSGHDHIDSHVDVFYDGRHLPFNDASFDAVVAFEVFEHVFNIDEMLQELRRVLRPGGRMMLTLPFAWGEHEVPYDFGRYTSFGIRSVLERNGLTVQSIGKTNGSVEAIHQLWLAYIDTQLLRPLGLVGKVARVPIAAAINIGAIALARILPDDATFYSNLVVEASRAHDGSTISA